MVTHELSLKAFAERVVWMRDGKIQTVENVPQKKRKDAFAKLEEDFSSLKLDMNLFSDGDEGGANGSVNAEADTQHSPTIFEEETQNVKSIKFRHTEIRQPTDYQQVKMIYGMKAEKHREKEKIAAAATLTKRKGKDKAAHHHTDGQQRGGKGKEKEENEDDKDSASEDSGLVEGELVDISDNKPEPVNDLLT